MTLKTLTQKDVAGIETMGDYAGAATNKAAVQVLIDLIEPFATQTHRGHLDQMSPVARIQLLRELESLYDKVVNA